MSSPSGLKPESHFKIHVAKAKDLPLSWYDLVLRPEKFAEHLETLREDPEAAPGAAHLIVTFLDKGDVLSTLSSALSTNTEFKETVEGEKKIKLVQCALLVASSLHWDSPQLWIELPLSVQFCLVSCLRSQYPLPVEGCVTRGAVNTEAIVSHVLYSVWVLRFVVQQCYSFQAPPKSVGQTWEANCTPAEQIKDIVRSKAEEAVGLLAKYLDQVDGLPGGDLPAHCAVPRVSVDLQVPSGGGKTVHLEPTMSPSTGDASFLAFLCKVRYALGCYYLVVGDFQKAQDQLQKTQEQLARVDCSYGGVDRGELQGYLAACESVLHSGSRGGGRGGGGGGDGREPSAALEHHFKRQDFKAMESVLVRDLCGKDKISSASILSLELEVENLNLATPPDPKRSRLDPSSAVSIKDRLVVYSSLKKILQGKPPPPRLWRMLEDGDNSPYLSFLLKVCDAIYKEGLPPKKKQLLWTFLRSVCTRNKKWWEMLLRTAVARQHAKRENTEGMFGPKVTTTSSSEASDPSTSHSSQVDRLERKVGLATSAKEVKEAVDELWEVLPSSQHSGLIAKWVWSGKGYAQAEAILNPVALIKYNCLLHRAQAMGKFQLYQQSLELLSAALTLLRTTECQSSKVKQLMEEFLQERILTLELKVFHKSGCGLGNMRGPLLAKARAYYMTTQHWAAHEWETWYVVGAFLLNLQEFQFISLQESKGHTVPSTLPYKLAEAVIKTKEGKDLRKSIRSLFEAVLHVFSPPLTTTDAKSEVLEKQAKLRSNLDLFIKNLTDPTSLSLLIAGLARIWNLLKKPEEEIITEYSGHWPTAIVNAVNIDAMHVLRMLNTTLSHALQLHPHSTSLILTKANTHNALCEYGAALEGYMEAAALSTSHFHDPVPEEVWPANILLRLINCCQRLNYHTQAAILCQLLQPVDYDLAFRILRENATTLLENMFGYFWDMTIIEYLIYIQSKKPDSNRHIAAVRVAGQADLNFHNSTEVLNRAAEVRRRKFLRTLYSQITHAF